MSEKKTILVIEDEIALQSAISDKLKREGYEPVLARTKSDGITALENNRHINMIWLDHYLFGQEDGLDFLNELRHNKNWQDIPIFVVSNTASKDKVNTYLALGIQKYYTKADSQLEQIVRDITNYLNNPNEG